MKRFPLSIGAAANIILFGALRFIALDADFPRSLTKSADLYTDEGAYASGAMNLHLRGSWIAEGDVNPLLSMPVTHVLQAVSFSLFGPGLGSARATAALCFLLICGLSLYFLWKHAGTPTALTAGVLLSTNYYLFAYSRFANNEMPMTLFLVLSVLLAFRGADTPSWLKGVAVGAAFSAAVLAKTTALFGLPLLVFALWRTGRDRRGQVMELGAFFGTTLALLGGYYGWTLLSFGEELRQYTSLNHGKRVSLSPLDYLHNIGRTLGKPIVTDPLLYPLVLLGAAVAALRSKLLREHTVFLAGALWCAGYLLLVNTSDYQPSRYAVPYAIAQAWLAGLLAVHAWRGQAGLRRYLVAGLVCAVVLVNVSRVGLYLATPEYSLRDTARNIGREMAATGVENPVLLGTPASTLGLAGNFRSLNSEFGTRDLAWRLEHYRPTHFVNLGNDPTEAAMLAAGILLEKTAEYDVYGNYATKEPLTLYRLHYPDGQLPR